MFLFIKDLGTYIWKYFSTITFFLLFITISNMLNYAGFGIRIKQIWGIYDYDELVP